MFMKNINKKEKRIIRNHITKMVTNKKRIKHSKEKQKSIKHKA